MEDRKNIDRFFREGFKNFEAVPEAHVWSAIEKKLGSGKKTPFMIPLIVRYGGIAAAIALLITFGYYMNPNHNSITLKENITNTTPENTVNDNTTRATKVKEEVLQDENNSGTLVNTALTNPNKNNTQRRRSPVKNTVFVANNTVTENNDVAVVKPHEEVITNPNDLSKKEDTKNGSISERKTPKEAIAASKKPVLDIPEKQDAFQAEDAIVENNTLNRWSIRPNAAPIYFNSLEGGSPIDRQFSDNSKSGNITASYGINIAYQLSKRISIRSGINRVSYGYNTNNIEFAGALEARSISTISYKNTAKHITVTDVDTSDPSLSQSPVTASKPSAYRGRMVQEFGYLEVPLEIKYRLLNKKVGIHIIGGLSSLFLTDNAISLETDIITTQIGSANNINTMNFSTNIGLGVDYQLSDTMLLNVEPIFKYQLNTFSNDDGGFRPYTLGVYTGLSFRF